MSKALVKYSKPKAIVEGNAKLDIQIYIRSNRGFISSTDNGVFAVSTYQEPMENFINTTKLRTSNVPNPDFDECEPES